MPVAERQQETGSRRADTSVGGLGITGRIGPMPRPERVLTWVWWACEDSMTDNTGTEGQVGHRDDTCGRGGTGHDGRCRCGERTGGRPYRLAVDRLAAGRGRRTASAAAHLHGIAGRRPGQGQESAEVAAPLPRQHAGQRAAGHGAKRWSRDGGGRREGCAGAAVQGRAGRLDAAPRHPLETEWEARFGPRSYGFRPGRGCHDAIVAIHTTASGRNAKRLWVLDADLRAAFDHIDHDHLLASLGTFPGRGMIAGWLQAGVVEKDRFTPTVEGTPQGGAATRKAHVVSGSRRLEVWLMSEA